MVLEDQAVAWVIERAKVTDQSVGFEDVMDRQQA
jgi:trigger factor